MGDHSLLTKLKVHTATVFRFYYVRLIKSEPCKCRCSSGVEQLPCKHQVGGSNPSIGSILFVKDSNSNDLPTIYNHKILRKTLEDEDKTVRHKFEKRLFMKLIKESCYATNNITSSKLI